jgi:hypothetical protein
MAKHAQRHKTRSTYTKALAVAVRDRAARAQAEIFMVVV